MRGDVINVNIKAFNKHSSGLIVKCLEIPHYAYSSRVRPAWAITIGCKSRTGGGKPYC